MNCTFKNCRKVADIIYLDQAYCNEHWNSVCNQQKKTIARDIAKKLKIKIDENDGQQRLDFLTGKRMSDE